jgi:cellulose synthase/poly-beta-1,6-N-acetylglucosamine synthase-like glycosyltransferase
MFFFWLLAILLTLIYITWIGIFYFGWEKTIEWRSRPDFDKPGISVIIAARDEESNISNLLSCLAQQEYPAEFLEVIVVDDHSTDRTREIVCRFATDQSNFRYLRLPAGNLGKKEALRHGIDNSRYPFILTTDADCTVTPEWVAIMAECFVRTGADLIAGPVLLDAGDGSLFGIFQQLEHLSLQGSTAGAITSGNPVMCSSANLAFRKEAYMDVDDPSRQKISSGDDVFLLLAMHKSGRRTFFVKSIPAVAQTSIEGSWIGFIQQRMRWASKSPRYNTLASAFTAALVFVFHLLLLLFLLGGFINSGFLLIAGMMLIFKSLVDFPFLYSITRFFGKKRLMFYFPLVQVIYLFYVNFITVASLSGNISWKGRRIKK